ncbi:hypothetical protein evm_002612 [Chilo suppressalis]|nr:hypothetical protein evm_002612 [Chilo suppressalis]
MCVQYIHHHTHQPINVPTAGAQAFPMDGLKRLHHDRGPSVDWNAKPEQLDGEGKQLSQWSVIGWVTESLLFRVPTCFRRHVKPLVLAASAVVSPPIRTGPRDCILYERKGADTTELEINLFTPRGI